MLIVGSYAENLIQRINRKSCYATAECASGDFSKEVLIIILSNCAITCIYMAYVAYKIRWVILFAIFVAAANRQMTVSSFGVRNSDIAKYFDASPYQVDVLSVGDAIVGTITCLCLSIIGRHVGVRTSSLIVGCCSTLGNLLVSVGFITRNYYCVFSGRLISGVAVGFMYILPGTFANAWFPSNQIATAFCMTFLGFNIGGTIASIVFSIEFPSDSHNASTNASESYNMETVGSLYSTVFEVSTATLLVATIILCCFSKDKPPTPPSEAEALLSQTYSEEKVEFDLKSDLLEAGKLLCNWPFVILTLGNFLDTAALVIVFTLVPSLITATFPLKGISRIISYVTISAYVGAACLAFASGRILDKTRWYKGICCGGSLASGLFGIGVALGHRYRSLVTVCIFYPLMFVTRVGTITSFVEFLVETTYPTNKTVLVSLHFTFYNAAYFIMTSLERVAFHSGGPAIANVIPIICSILGSVCAFVVEPDYKRTKANQTETASAK